MIQTFYTFIYPRFIVLITKIVLGNRGAHSDNFGILQALISITPVLTKLAISFNTLT